MLGELRFEHPLHERRLELVEQALRPEQLLRAFDRLHELFQELRFQRHRCRITHRGASSVGHPLLVQLHKFSDTLYETRPVASRARFIAYKIRPVASPARFIAYET